MVQHLLDACNIQKNDYHVAVLALFLSPRTVPNVSVYGPDHHFQDQWLDVERCCLIFLHLVVSVSSSFWWLRMEIGVLVLAELIVCATRGLACILAKRFWPPVMSLSDIWKSGGFMY